MAARALGSPLDRKVAQDGCGYPVHRSTRWTFRAGSTTALALGAMPGSPAGKPALTKDDSILFVTMAYYNLTGIRGLASAVLWRCKSVCCRGLLMMMISRCGCCNVPSQNKESTAGTGNGGLLALDARTGGFLWNILHPEQEVVGLSGHSGEAE